MRGGYHVVDEPMPGRLAESVVSPSWCLFAVMFGGTWLSWPWFVWNGFALGSPTRRREAVWAAAGFVGAVAYLFVLGFLLDEGLLPDAAAPYGLLLLSTWKVTVSYLLYTLQARAFDLHQHFGQEGKNGFVVVALGSVVGKYALDALPTFWQIVLG